MWSHSMNEFTKEEMECIQRYFPLGCFCHAVYDVTHFCIPEPVEIDE